MENLVLLTNALEFIESNLTQKINTEDIAAAVFCSKSQVEKIFRYYSNISVRDYIIRRRMSLAAVELRKNPSVSLLELALKFGYGSNEAFSRVFKSIWRVTPSEYRLNPNNFELFPSYRIDRELMEDNQMKDKKHVDISELYDLLRDRKNCYFVGADISSLIPINEIAHEAGDLAILEALKRLEDVCGPEDVPFRIGGDEFVILTGSEDIAYAESLVEAIKKRNGETVRYQDKDIPVNLYLSAFKIDIKPLCYSKLFSKMQEELTSSKRR